MTEGVGDNLSSVREFDYLTLPRSAVLEDTYKIDCVTYSSAHQPALLYLGVVCRGRVYIESEDLVDDPNFYQAGELYRAAGLSRTRQIVVAYRRGPPK